MRVSGSLLCFSVHVRITGVPDARGVTVRATMIDSDGVRWESVNRFRGRDGVVDLGLSEVARQRLEAHDFPFPYEHISYPDAGHSFPPPFMPATSSQSPNGFLRGGSTEGTARAMEDAWRRVLEFLDDALKRDR